MRRLLTATFLLLLLLPAATALAADRPQDLLIDACRDEKVDGTYSQRTYRRALDDLPADSDQYSACRDVINRARLAALNASNRDSGGGGNGGGGSTGNSGGGGSSSGGGGGSSNSSGGGGSSGAGGGTATGRSTSRAPAPRACNGCTGSGTALDTATPKERHDVESAVASGANPVRIGGELLRPGAVGALTSDSHTLPTSLVVLLAALGACALAAAGAVGWSRVVARRAR